MLPKLIPSPTLNFYIVLNVAYHMNHVKIKCIGKCDGEQGAFIFMPETWETTTPKNSKTNKQLLFLLGMFPPPHLALNIYQTLRTKEQVEGKETTWVMVSSNVWRRNSHLWLGACRNLESQLLLCWSSLVVVEVNTSYGFYNGVHAKKTSQEKYQIQRSKLGEG